LRTSVAEGIAFFVLVAAGVRVLGWVANARGLLQPASWSPRPRC
jgi:hypothetical protein